MSEHECVDQGESHATSSFESELTLANDLLAAGDRKHALHHYVGALSLAPNREEWRAPLAQLLADPALLATLDDQEFFGAHAARAFHLHARGELAQAVELAASLHGVVPHLGFDRWLVAWALEAEAKAQKPEAMPLLRALMLVQNFGVGRLSLLPAERAAAADLVPVAELAMRLVPEDPRIALLASSVMRRAGKFDDAARAADRAREMSASPEQWLTVKGLALRGARRFEEALACFDDAFRAGDDPVYLMERFRTLTDAGRWQEALEAWTKFGTLRQPDEENLQERAVVERALAMQAPPPTSPPLDLVRRRAVGHARIWPMEDATANTLRQIGMSEGLRAMTPREAGEAFLQGSVQVNVDGHEGASNRMTLALMLTRQPDPRRGEYRTNGSNLQTVVADDSDEFRLWKVEGDVVVQAMPAPSDAVLAWIEDVAIRESDGSIAESEFETTADFLDMWAAASAKPLPPSSSARDWVAATVHPRLPLIRSCSGPDWVHRWQIVALLGLARSETGWAGTARRAAFLSLLRGAIDWPMAAAIRVAAELALREPETTRELRAALIDLVGPLKDVPNGGLPRTLRVALEMIPFVPREYIERLQES